MADCHHDATESGPSWRCRHPGRQVWVPVVIAIVTERFVFAPGSPAVEPAAALAVGRRDAFLRIESPPPWRTSS